MKQPDEKICGALLVLTGNPHFKMVLGWFRESLAEQDSRNRREQDDALLRQGQGHAACMDDFLKTVDAAPETLERIRSAPGRRAQNELANQ